MGQVQAQAQKQAQTVVKRMKCQNGDTKLVPVGKRNPTDQQEKGDSAQVQSHNTAKQQNNDGVRKAAKKKDKDVQEKQHESANQQENDDTPTPKKEVKREDPFLQSRTYREKTNHHILQRRKFLIQYLDDDFKPIISVDEIVAVINPYLERKTTGGTVYGDIGAYKMVRDIMKSGDGAKKLRESGRKIPASVQYFLTDWEKENGGRQETKSEKLVAAPSDMTVSAQVDHAINLLNALRTDNERLVAENNRLRKLNAQKEKELQSISQKLGNALTKKRDDMDGICGKIIAGYGKYRVVLEEGFRKKLVKYENSGDMHHIVDDLNTLITYIDDAHSLSFRPRKLGKSSRYPGSTLVTVFNNYRMVYKRKKEDIIFQDFCTRENLGTVLGQNIS